MLFACLLAILFSARADDAATSLTLQRVKLADTACGQACPEWLSAQGTISRGDAERLRKALDALGPRKIPLLIHCNGGLVEEALEMGEMVREKGLQVGVARTTVAQCVDPAGCPDVRGSFATLDATSFSACTLVLAGGIGRFATPLTQVGVHQMRNAASRTVVERLYRDTYEVVNGVERFLSRELVNSQTRIVTPSTPDFERLKQKVRLYLTDMGIDEKVWALAMETPANEIFNLHPGDLRALR